MQANAVVQFDPEEPVDRGLSECGVCVERHEVFDAFDQQPHSVGRHALQLDAAG